MTKEFFEFVENLKNIPRQGWLDKLEIKNPESVADHCFSLTVMAMVFSDLQNLDTKKVLKMSLLHDLAESTTGDYTPEKISKKEKAGIEKKEIEKILSKLPKDLFLKYLDIWDEYYQNETLESRLVHQLDKLEMAFQALVYEKQGHSREKIKPFIDSAISETTDPQLSDFLNKLLQK